MNENTVMGFAHFRCHECSKHRPEQEDYEWESLTGAFAHLMKNPLHDTETVITPSEILIGIVT